MTKKEINKRLQSIIDNDYKENGVFVSSDVATALNDIIYDIVYSQGYTDAKRKK